MLNIKRRLFTAACTAGIFGGVAFSPAINVFAAPEEKDGGNDTFETADELAPNKEVTGSISAKEDVDFYKVTFSKNGKMNLSFTAADVNDGDSFWQLRIYDEKKIPLNTAYYQVYGNTKGAVQTFSDKGVSAGTYYIEVLGGYYSNDWVSDDYKLKVNFEATDSWEGEWNDSLETAQKIDVNKDITGNITVKDDADWYQFTLTEPGSVRYSFVHDYIDDDDTFWSACLYDDTGANLLNESYFRGNYRATVNSEHVGVPAGTYYLKVWHGYYANDWDSTKNYTFNVEYEASSDWETEDNGSVETADVIEIGKAIHASRTRKDDVDYFKVNIPKDGVATIKFGHNRIDSSDVFWLVNVLDDNASEIKDAQFEVKGNTTGVQKLGEVELTAGTCYISVGRKWDDSYIDYSLQVDFKASEAKPDGLNKDEDGKFYYYEGGVKSHAKDGSFVDYQGGKFYIENTAVATSKKGLQADWGDVTDGVPVWYYIADGQVVSYTGLAEYDNEWFYVENGKLDTKKGGFVEYDGSKFFVAAGRIVRTQNFLTQDPKTGDWYYLSKGQVVDVTTLAEYDGEWFYIIKGKLAEDYTGTVEYNGAEFNVVNGMVK